MGSKVGTKRADKRWRDNDGTVWDSEFEFRVYTSLRSLFGGRRVRRAESAEGDSFDYTTPTKQGRCLDCGSGKVVQQRTYTPDIYVIQSQTHKRTYIETKGYFPADKRTLLRNFRKTGPSIDLIIILQRNGRATPTRSLAEWVGSYIENTPTFVWDPKKADIPDELIAYLL